MLNFKHKFYIAGVFALCIFASCSSETPSTAGSTTIPNGIAENDSIMIEDGKPIIPEITELCYSSKGDGTAAYCGAIFDRWWFFYESWWW